MPFNVFHPQPAQAVNRKRFIAYGNGKRSDQIIGILYDSDNQPVATGKRIRTSQNRLWALQFDDYPQTVIRLDIHDDRTGNRLARLGITVRMGPTATEKSPPPPRDYAINPIYPEQNETVYQDFISYGETDETDALSASVGATNGVCLFGPPENPGYWCFEFAQVAVGNNQTLTIVGSEAPIQRNINVIANP